MGAIMNKLANLIGFDSVEDEVEEPIAPQNHQTAPKEDKVVRFNEVRNKQNFTKSSSAPMSSMSGYDIEHIILAPSKFEDAKYIADEIKSKKIITLNMSVVGVEIAQRILDFISGTAYAVDSKITKISDNVFISVPNRIKETNKLPSKEPVNEILKDKPEAYTESEEITRVFAR